MWLQGCSALHWDLGQVHEGPGLGTLVDQPRRWGGQCWVPLWGCSRRHSREERRTPGLGMMETLDHTLACPWPDGFLAELHGHLGPSGPTDPIIWSWGSCRPRRPPTCHYQGRLCDNTLWVTLCAAVLGQGMGQR